MLEIYSGKQHYIENFNFIEFLKKYNNLPYEGQRAFIDSFDISTNPEWLDLKRGYIGASSASDFLTDSAKVSGIKRTKAWGEMTEAQKKEKLSEIPLEERLGEGCKALAYKILAERRTNWREHEASWAEKTSIKRGLVFESVSSYMYARDYKLEKEDLQDVLFVRRDDLVGFSPDKLILKDGIRASLEIKNFEPPHFYKAVMDFDNEKVIKQAQFQIFVGKLNYVDIMLCNQEENKYKVFRYQYGLDYQQAIKIRLEEFKEYLELIDKRINSELRESGV